MGNRIRPHLSPEPSVAGPLLAGTASLILAFTSVVALAQTRPVTSKDGTQSIQREEMEKLQPTKAPTYQTREERLATKPLVWDSTIGKPTPRRLTPAEAEVLKRAKPESSEGGTAHPQAREEARKLYPTDWQ
jgi:hypothetical protein